MNQWKLPMHLKISSSHYVFFFVWKMKSGGKKDEKFIFISISLNVLSWQDTLSFFLSLFLYLSFSFYLSFVLSLSFGLILFLFLSHFLVCLSTIQSFHLSFSSQFLSHSFSLSPCPLRHTVCSSLSLFLYLCVCLSVFISFVLSIYHTPYLYLYPYSLFVTNTQSVSLPLSLQKMTFQA